MTRARVRERFAAALFLWVTAFCGAQEPTGDLNDYYRFPFSVGIEYQNLSPFAAYGSGFNVFELSTTVRRPVPSIPMLQPAVRVGMMRFDSQDLADPLEWDHTHWYAAAGAAFAHRFARTFEVGGEALAGFSEALFPNLLAEEGTVSSGNLLFEVGGRIALDPSYNLSIDVHPNLKYLRSLSPLQDFDGFVFGIGFSASYRFGRDPDAPGSLIRSLRFTDTAIRPVFAAMQSYYVKNPVGTVTITNTEERAITDLEVSFFQPGYMDSPTPATSIAELAAGESREIPVPAAFNAEVFATEGVTPLTGEIIAVYRSRGRPAEQRQSVSYDLHDRTAITWDDDRKVGAFITPSDSALRNYASFIRQTFKEATLPAYDGTVQYGMQLYQALAEIGCLYQPDPVAPFTAVQVNPLTVDSISLPRDTLKRITGDCDDLTVLYASLLEAVGIESGFITVPGHIYAAINTKVPSREYRTLHPDRSMFIELEGELWLPVEITLIGKEGFRAAWKLGVDEWAIHEKSPEKRRLIVTRDSQTLYRSVGLKETDLGLQYGRPEAMVRSFRQDMDGLVDVFTGAARTAAARGGGREDHNRLGIAYARFGRLQDAQSAFSRALAIDPGYISARVNLGNLLFLKEDYPAALSAYERALASLAGEAMSPLRPKILLNVSRTYHQMQRYDEAGRYFASASAIDPAQAQAFAYLAERQDGGGRAGDQGGGRREILFLGEEE